MYLPCGKCLGCKSDQARDWGVRIIHEAQLHEQNSFLTLTYDDEHYPSDGKISKHELQKFIKRLRKQLDHQIRYFAVGEYGEKTHRAHYHAIIFGDDFLGARAKPVGDRMWSNSFLNDCWGNGMVHVAKYEPATAMYTAGYVTKKLGNTDTFNLMSRRPPIGKNWLKKYHNQVRQLGHCTLSNGQQVPIPKKYMDWMEGVCEWDELKEKRQQIMSEKPVKTDYQLRSKGLNMQSKNSLKEHKI